MYIHCGNSVLFYRWKKNLLLAPRDMGGLKSQSVMGVIKWQCRLKIYNEDHQAFQPSWFLFHKLSV